MCFTHNNIQLLLKYENLTDGLIGLLLLDVVLAARNGTEGPDLGMVGGLWAQYQNALALNGKQLSPSGRVDPSSPVENQDETNSSGQKDDDELSEDDSEDRIDANAQDPERLKAFNVGFITKLPTGNSLLLATNILLLYYRCLFDYLWMKIWIA